MSPKTRKIARLMLFGFFGRKTQKKLIILPGCKWQEFAILKASLTQTYNQKTAKKQSF